MVKRSRSPSPTKHVHRKGGNCKLCIKTGLTNYKKLKSNKSKRKSLVNSQYKTIEYPDYQDKSDLVGTDLRNKVIHGAYMKNMNLSHAKLHGTKFVDCTFIHVNFDHAFIDKGTEFINCKFKECKTDSIKYVNGARQVEFENVFFSSDA